MGLIDYFNVFQNITKGLKLSANARSLYIAILGEFNSARYPETLGLANRGLQEISGIRSDSSFHSARNALINAGLIAVKKNFYRLTATAPSVRAPDKNAELQSEVTAKEPEVKKFSQESLSVNSPEVLKAWYDNKGEKLAGGKALGLIRDEKLYGADAVIKAIETAGTSNNYEEYPQVIYQYYKKILEGQQKGGTDVGSNTTGASGLVDNAQYAGIDICPD